MYYAPQAVVAQPIGKDGILIAGTNTQRGFSRLDQAWIASLADKIEVSMEGFVPPQGGVGFGSSSKSGAKA